jgi:hypothetical protein
MMEPRIASRTRQGLLAFALLASSPTFAAAQVGADIDRAQQLFDEARALMQQARYAEACPKLAESYARDPGGGTMLNLGICHERLGRNATAFGELQQALSFAQSTGRPDRERTARNHLVTLAPLLSHLTIRLPAGAAAATLSVQLDGAQLAPAADGWSLPVDPGAHEIRASAPGKVAWALRVTLGAVADHQTVAIPSLAAQAPATSAAQATRARPSAEAPGTEPAQLSAVATPKTERTSTLRLTGYALAGSGAVALGVGGFFGLRALSLRSESNRTWDGKTCSDQRCEQAWANAKTSARLSDIGVGVGLVALSAGVYLVLRSPATSPAAASTVLSVQATAAGGSLGLHTGF